MSNFEQAYSRTMGNEGGWVNNPRDNGGETYKGISRKNWPKWSGWRLIDSIKDTLLKQPDFGTSEYRAWVKHLNDLLAASVSIQSAVAEFYRANFWGNLSDITDQRVAEEIFDKRVNCGDIACRWIQRAAGTGADGVIGPVTVAAINAADPTGLMAGFNDCAKRYYDGILERDPSQEQFRHAWFARLKNYDETPFVA